MIFAERQELRLAVGGATGRKNDSMYSIVQHCRQQVQTGLNIVLEVFSGILHGLADIGAGGKMNHSLWLVFVEGPSDGHFVRQIRLDQGTPFHRPFMACTQVVECDGSVTRLCQSLRGMTSD